MRDLGEVLYQNPEPYNSIYNFIKREIIPKYPCLTSVHQANFDEEGNPRIQYFIRYAADLSISQWDQLFMKIFNDILSFCRLCGISYDDLDVDVMLTIDGEFNEK